MQQSATLDIEQSDGETEIVQSSSATSVPKMLIVDDDPLVLRLLADRCERIGFDVETASNGIQALLKASRIQPAILVIDVNMPEMDGLSTCAHLLEPDRAPVEVIVMTGGKNPETPERCEGFGAYFARKGPNFWNDLEAALAEIDPRLTEPFRRCRAGAVEHEVRRRPRVLLVDDDNDVNRMLASRLASDQINQRLRRDIRGRPGAAHVLCKSEDTSALFETLQKFCGFEPASMSPTAAGGRQLTQQTPRIVGPCSELAAAAFGRFNASRGRTN